MTKKKSEEKVPENLIKKIPWNVGDLKNRSQIFGMVKDIDPKIKPKVILENIELAIAEGVIEQKKENVINRQFGLWFLKLKITAGDGQTPKKN